MTELGKIWINGDVLACACPNCSAPMSIRLWLRLADCWRCGTCVELTEEQQREARRLMKEIEARREAEEVAAAPPPVEEPVPAPRRRWGEPEAKDRGPARKKWSPRERW